MKARLSHLLALFLLSGACCRLVAQVTINATNFPDDIFKSWISSNCDTDHNGVLSSEELSLTVMNVQNKGILDLTGIEHFTALKVLNCGGNHLSSINLSMNTALTRLLCNNNQLTQLDVSPNTKLTNVDCSLNRLTGSHMTSFINSLPTIGNGSTGTLSLVSKVPEETEYNTYTEADVLAAANKGWQVKDTYGNDVLTIVNAATFPDETFRNYISATVDTDHNGILSNSEKASVTTLNVSGLGIGDLTGLQLFTNLKVLDCRGNQLTQLSLLSFNKLTTLYCQDNQLTDISYIQAARNLTKLHCYNNRIADMSVFAGRFPNEAPSVGELVVRSSAGSEGNAMPTDANISHWNEKNWKVYSIGADGSLTELRTSTVVINALNFPDATFRNYVWSFDSNRDGSLSNSELQAVGEINVAGTNVASLQGLEYFTEVTILRCANCQLTELDLRKNRKLTTLYCQENRLTTLDLTYNTALSYVVCYGNNIGASGMQTLVNCLPDVTGEAGRLVVYDTGASDGNAVITSQQVLMANDRNWRVYSRDDNGLTEIEALSDIDINAQNFPDITFRQYVSQFFDTDKNNVLSDLERKAATSITCWLTGVSSLKGIEFFPELTAISCQNNGLRELDVSNNPKLEILECRSNRLKTLDVSHNPLLTSLSCSKNDLTEIVFGNNSELQSLHCCENKLESLDLSSFGKLTILDCGRNQLTTLDVSCCPELQKLYCNNNRLKALDVRTANRKLELLHCYNNELKALDVKFNPELKTLHCYRNKLVSLAIEGSNVEELYCEENELEGLNLRNCENLKTVFCYSNYINGAGMDALVAALPTVEGITINLVSEGYFYEENECTAAQAFVARQKGWIVNKYDSGAHVPWVGTLPIAINDTYFPDNTFRSFVSTNYDTNHDGQLSDDEVEDVEEMDVKSKSIEDLTGVEYFSNLVRLHCERNSLTRLVLLYHQNLEEAHCYNNHIQGAGMQELFDNLPKHYYDYATLVACSTFKGEGNDLPSSTQTAIAESQNWKVFVQKSVGGMEDIAATQIDINASTFPDEVFRNYVSQHIDTDHDDVLTYAELDAVTELQVPDMGIGSLKGVEFFSQLTTLVCRSNNLAELDLAKNRKLEVLDCAENRLTRLDVRANTELGNLDCANNQLAALNVSTNTKLWRLYCGCNQIVSLDLTNNTALDTLFMYNMMLTSLILPETTTLRSLSCYNAGLTSLDVSKNTGLTYLNCSDNNFTELDLSNNTALVELYCQGGKLTSLDVSKNTALKILWCTNNELTALNLSKNTALEELYCNNNALTALDVTRCAALLALDCHHNQLTELDVSYNWLLEEFNCSYNQLTALDVKNLLELTTLECEHNQLAALDVKNLTMLTTLKCNNNLLATLNVSNCNSLQQIYCHDNKLRKEGMDDFVVSLPMTRTNSQTIYIYRPSSDTEWNFLQKEQYLIAAQKGWRIAYYVDEEWRRYFGEDGEPDDTPTGIGEAMADDQTTVPQTNGQWYSLDGRRINGKSTKKGVYVVDGKKVIVM